MNIISVKKDKIILSFLVINYIINAILLYNVWWIKMMSKSIDPVFLAVLVRLQVAIPGVIVIFILLYNVAQRRRIALKYNYEKFLIIFLPLAFISFLIGVFYGNSWLYLLGDTYSLSFVPLLYLCGIFLYYQDSLEKILKNAFNFFIFLAFIDFFIQLFNFIFLKQLMVLSFSSFTFPFIYLFIRDKKSRKDWLIILMLVISGILTLKRGNWVTLFLIPLFAIMLENGFRPKLIIAKNFLVIAAVLALFAGSFNILFPDRIPELNARFQNSISSFDFFQMKKTGFENQVPKMEGGIEGRVAESMIVTKQMGEEGNFFNYMMGFGNGVEYKTAFAPSILSVEMVGMGSKEGQVHSIHSTWVAFFFRTGFLGAVLFAIFSFLVLYKLWRAIKKRIFSPQHEFYAKVIFIAIAISVVQSIQGLVFWGDIWMGPFLIMMGYLFRDQSKSLLPAEDLSRTREQIQNENPSN